MSCESSTKEPIANGTLVPSTNTPNTPATIRKASLMPSPPSRVHVDPAADAGAGPGFGTDRELTVQGREPVGDPLKPGAVHGRAGIEPASVVGDLEREVAVGLRDRHAGRARLGVLGDVLQRLETREVDGRLDLGRVPADPVGPDRDRDCRTLCLGVERRLEALVGQQWRVDPAREVAEVLERRLQLA